ncbi:hypothetical protein [Pseudomonas sp. GD03696]|uniref:hypothetical protein n=1 Tax=Pseudomonas sp. GD03696 TaxID=2975368 RepID=UPI002449D962|nr:hypothetical protein [Pseudomonas sp. GD03696]MDH1930476.1 hypothetical protein [Pseudomonas sp. GD03696]
MKRRAISDDDLKHFIQILREWDVSNDGSLSWQGLIKSIERVVGYSYERTTLYKAKGGALLREFQIAKSRVKVNGAPAGRGSTMSRQDLLKAYAKQALEIERLRAENDNLMKLHVKYLKLFFENDIIPG